MLLNNMSRVRTPIIELFSGKAFPNELRASEFFNISRYHVNKSWNDRMIVKNAIKENCAFAVYSFGMDNLEMLKLYK